ncbi:hypothetical protein DYB25_007758 [Aphanomyces astaci]|uniref:Uncharacterized protein n=1 Tax=Aphanomyces astaci TaxID=112090 RepID=A0A396ZR38_APHAT|nr:hypothetical protein DYB36_003382 [Aphanomyces astaci]RHX97611.1 hypothetical protein DYB25_007758 [Aphanomyces astaci]RHY41273.1 hypothetical protein DYB34_006862 [Aphanomyces astaci]RHY52895.1 hypothetical protein DYB30_005557 [Aphanomyces astaci]RHY69798.1 hypothetical protein DYB38_006387 [Aphanomyces astaci]
MPPRCFFNQCPHPATNINGVYKCVNHRYRAKCNVEACPNQAYARNMCVRHGGKATCKVETCQSKCRVGDYCIRHGPTATRPRCSADSCDKLAHPATGKCSLHGGGHRFCKLEGCFSKGQHGDGLCSFHRHVQRAQTPAPEDTTDDSTDDDEDNAELMALLMNSEWALDSLCVPEITPPCNTSMVDLLDPMFLFSSAF